MMPSSAALSGTRGLPPLGLGGSGGKSGLTPSHSASLNKCLTIVVGPSNPGISGRASSPPRAVLAVPSHGLPYGLLEWCGVVAEGSREVRVVHDERLLELVEHLDRLAQRGVEETQCPQQDLRCRLDACWLADLLEDHLHELARLDRRGAG